MKHTQALVLATIALLTVPGINAYPRQYFEHRDRKWGADIENRPLKHRIISDEDHYWNQPTKYARFDEIDDYKAKIYLKELEAAKNRWDYYPPARKNYKSDRDWAEEEEGKNLQDEYDYEGKKDYVIDWPIAARAKFDRDWEEKVRANRYSGYRRHPQDNDYIQDEEQYGEYDDGYDSDDGDEFQNEGKRRKPLNPGQLGPGPDSSLNPTRAGPDLPLGPPRTDPASPLNPSRVGPWPDSPLYPSRGGPDSPRNPSGGSPDSPFDPTRAGPDSPRNPGPMGPGPALGSGPASGPGPAGPLGPSSPSGPAPAVPDKPTAVGAAVKPLASLEGPPKPGARALIGFDPKAHLAAFPQAGPITSEKPLEEGKELVGPCGYKVKLQTDGNVAIVRSEGGVDLWDSKSAGVPGRHPFQLTIKDGKFQLVSTVAPFRQVWAPTTTPPNAVADQAMIGPDGNLIVVDATGNQIWESGIFPEDLCKTGTNGTESRTSI